MVVDLNDGTHISISPPYSAVFALNPKPLIGHVYLNSTNYGSGWYVKYCLNLNNTVNNPNVNALQVSGNVSLIGAQDNGYFSQSGLKYLIFHQCGGSSNFSLPDPLGSSWDPLESNGTQMITTGPDLIVLNWKNPLVNQCSWTVNLQETATSLRWTQHGATPLPPYAAEVNTILNILLQALK
jgi:hypothetical protein